MQHPFLKITFTLATTLIALLLGSTYYYYSPLHPTITKAVAVIHPTKGNNVAGDITFVSEKDGLHITATITGLSAGKHGFHIHEFGDCTAQDGTSAGAHFNPLRKHHGAPTDRDRHAGDLGNIVADAQGNATYSYVDTQATLNGPNCIIGRTVIVHELEDDFKTQPTGNAGARLGCGVIGIAQNK